MIENTKAIAEKNKAPFNDAIVEFASKIGDWDVYSVMNTSEDVGFPMIAVNRKTGAIQKGNDSLEYKIAQQEGLLKTSKQSEQSTV